MPKRLAMLMLITAVNLAVVVMVISTMSSGPGEPVQVLTPDAIVQVSAKPAEQVVAPEDELTARVLPFLNKYCISCHGPDKQSADLTLHKYPDKLSILRGRKTWLNVAHMIQEGEMPSGRGPKPTVDEREWIVKWIDQTLNKIDCDNRDPGRVTIRRLNRMEYNNTVRDLLGVKFMPAEDFPTDDVGYGFDNIGDVLSMPPVLLEKYLRAAEQVSSVAIANDPGRKPTEVRHITGRDLRGGTREDRVKVLSTNGDATREIDLPRDGKYEFKIYAWGSQAGDEPVKMALVIDGKELHTFEVRATRGRGQECIHTVELAKGRREFALRFLNDFTDPDHPDANRRDRNLYIGELEITGPILDKPEITVPSQIFTRLPKNPGEWTEVATEILRRKARQAYRRPVTDDEVKRLLRFVDLAKSNGDSFENAIGLSLQAMLVSPHFLFRIELDPEPTNPNAIRSLNDHELATRLSYFLWSSMPDDELLSLADKGILRQPAILEKQIRSMLTDRRANALVQSFAGQWLQLRSLERVTPDRRQFPDFDQDLRDSMLRETELFFEAVIREDRSVLDFIDGRFTFVNGRLAKHYGIPGITGDSFRRIELDGVQRSGILTQASILTITSNPTRTSPVLRGKYVLEEILGTPPPPAPPDVPELPAAEGDGAKPGETLSMRERLKQHLTNPTCASCHDRMDPIGFGMENYDGIGKWRTSEGKHPIDPSGTMPTGESFQSPAQLKAMLLDRKPLFTRNLSEKMLTFALGRGLEYYDKCAVDDIVKALEQNDHRFSALVMAIVQSDPFTKRRGKLADEP